MKIGILSDTHGKDAMAAAAVALLQLHGAEYFIHCGDIGSPQVLDRLAGLKCTVVFGNTDYDRQPLARYARDLGIDCQDPHADLTLAGKRIAVIHGDDGKRMRELIDGQAFDYLLSGHTHEPADFRHGRTRLINPGALHRAIPKTVALLDLALDRLQRFEVTGT
jgi:putative phosphoesterase